MPLKNIPGFRDVLVNLTQRACVVAAVLALTACASLDHHCCENKLPAGSPGSNTSNPPFADEVLKTTSSSDPIQWPRDILVYRPSHSSAPLNGAGILLLHEINGASPACLFLAHQLAEEVGCPVYLPILFGTAGQDDSVTGFSVGFFDEDWSGVVFSEHHTPRIVDKLRGLQLQISQVDHIHRWAVIGMCFTGSFPLAFLSNPDVKVGVIAQPATPLIHLTSDASYSLGLSREDLTAAARSSALVFGFRFEGDCISPEARLDHTAKLLRPGTFEDCTIREKDFGCYVQVGAHNTLTYARDLHAKENPVNQSVAELIKNLQSALVSNPQ